MSLNEYLTYSLTSEEIVTTNFQSFLICIAVSLVLGIFIAATYTYKTKHTKSFVATLTVLPAVVCMIIMMVNGNIGTGVAVAGAFSLVRFRSVPGSAKEIGAIFIAMGSGLAIGMGYIGFSIVFALIISIANMFITNSSFGEAKNTSRILVLTVPESLNYTNAFDEEFKKYTNSVNLTKVKSTNMGSLFKLSYDLNLISENLEKDFIDDLRIKNGNLDIVISRGVTVNEL